MEFTFDNELLWIRRGRFTAVVQSLPAPTGQDMGAEQSATALGSPYRPLCGRYCHPLPER